MNPAVTPVNSTQGIDDTALNINLMAKMVSEIVADMSLGACAETITQTVQILDVGKGRKAALRITVTTDPDAFM